MDPAAAVMVQTEVAVHPLEATALQIPVAAVAADTAEPLAEMVALVL